MARSGRTRCKADSHCAKRVCEHKAHILKNQVVGWVRSLGFFDFVNLATLVVAAVRAYSVRQAQVVAVCALRQIAGLQGVMRPAAITAAFANFLFWKRCHLFFLSNKIPAGGQADRIIRI